jgi:hypothetical protein
LAGYSKSETALAVIRRERDGFDNNLSGLKRKTNKQREILDVQNLDISNQDEKNKLQKQITAKSKNVRKDAQEIRDKLDTPAYKKKPYTLENLMPLENRSGSIPSLERNIRKNEKQFGLKSEALKDNQREFEEDVIKALKDKLSLLNTQEHTAKQEHVRLQEVKREREDEIVVLQNALEAQVRHRMETVLAECKSTEAQFQKCEQMIADRNKTVQQRIFLVQYMYSLLYA